MSKKSILISLVVLAESICLAACSSPSGGSDEIQLAFHQFVAVGQSVRLGNIGTILEVLQLTATNDTVIDYNSLANTVTCEQGGIACLRAQHRDSDTQNEIQTKCFICIDETGDCEGENPVSLDFETFLLEENTEGDANYLAQGSSSFYAVCKLDNHYRLQQTVQTLPALWLLLPDALVDEHPYALGSESFDRQRNVQLVNYSGESSTLPWSIQLSHTVTGLTILGDGGVSVNDPDCDTPSCSFDSSLVQVGDLVTLGYGFEGSSDLENFYMQTAQATIDSFVATHGIESWDDLVPEGGEGDLRVDVRRQVVYRLISLQILAHNLDFYDVLYDLKAQEIPVSLGPYWATRYPILNFCHPNDEEVCERLEGEVASREAELIQSWLDAGFNLWSFNNLAYAEDGSYQSLLEELPAYTLFNGLYLRLSAGRPLNDGLDRVTVISQAMASLAAQVGSLDVRIETADLPISSFDLTELCEAEICNSDFSAYFELYEALFLSMLDNFLSDQLKGFSMPLFDGSHFDIREPHETKGDISLNRIGETGFNNPLLNLYLSQ